MQSCDPVSSTWRCSFYASTGGELTTLSTLHPSCLDPVLALPWGAPGASRSAPFREPRPTLGHLYLRGRASCLVASSLRPPEPASGLFLRLLNETCASGPSRPLFLSTGNALGSGGEWVLNSAVSCHGVGGTQELGVNLAF